MAGLLTSTSSRPYWVNYWDCISINKTYQKTLPTFVIMDYIESNFEIRSSLFFLNGKAVFHFFLLFKGEFMSLGLTLSTSLSFLVSDGRDFTMQPRLPGLILTPHHPKVRLELKNLILNSTLKFELNWSCLTLIDSINIYYMFFLTVWRMGRRAA